MAHAQLTGAQPSNSPQAQRITLEAYLELFGEHPHEVIDGVLIPMTPQQFRSSRIAHDLYDKLKPFVTEKKLGRVWMETVYAFEVDQDTNWLEGSLVPDVSFTSQPRLEEHLRQHGEEGPLRIAPDLAVEIISPTDKFSYVMAKVTTYLRFGVQLIWVIDPQNHNVWVITQDDPEGHTLGETDTLSGDPVLPGLSIPIARLLQTLTEA
jgi:Uma2 family endonuclease